MRNYLKIIKINEFSATPKYKQVYNSILDAIGGGLLEINDPMPSINDLSIGLEISRNTVERAYRDLKLHGVINAVPGKGYFIASNSFEKPQKILLLFNKLSSHKKIIYDSFAAQLPPQYSIDFYVYNNDFLLFKRILSGDLQKYVKLVIIPHFIDDDGRSTQLLENLPKDKLILMDKLVNGITGEFNAVYEDFEKDIFSALVALNENMQNYTTLKLVFPEQSYYSKSILTGFLNFCNAYGFKYEIISSLENEVLKPNTAYINLKEDDLVALIEKVLPSKLKIGTDIGIISYNETPIKKIILDGITTISTDFVKLGQVAAAMVCGKQSGLINIPFSIIKRKSL